MASIGIDGTFVRPGVAGGAQQMLENLLEALVAASPPEDRLIAYGKPSRETSSRIEWVAPPGGGNRFLQSTRLYRAHRRGLDAMLFPNYFTPPRGPRRSIETRPRVVTVIHDLHYLTHPDSFSRAKRAWLRASHELTLRTADVVVTVSEQVREDVLSRYGRRWANRVVAIPNAISWDRFQRPDGAAASSREQGSGRYVLSVGAQYPHKNLSTLLEAFAILRRRAGFDDVTLVLVGQWSHRIIGIARTVDLRTEAAVLELGGAVRFTGYVDDAEVGDLYRGASAFVFPSLFEGFGMPPVEALGFGLPVLTTRRTAIPETTLGLATYLDDPLDAGAMADALAAILERPEEFRPSMENVERIRETYAPERIGAMYRAALLG